MRQSSPSPPFPLSPQPPGGNAALSNGAKPLAAGQPAFDPYHKWLGIRDPQRPPNHYRLLGLELYESDLEVIKEAAERQQIHLRKFRAGPYRDLCQQMLEELATAKATLCEPVQRSLYDRLLQQQQGLAAVIAQSQQAGAPPTKNIAKHAPSPDTSTDDKAVCNECGWENDAEHQYCCGCGGRLWDPCIACGEISSASEKHCGHCGANLATALHQQAAALTSKLLQVRLLRDQFRHDEAQELLNEVLGVHHPRLRELHAQARQMHEQMRDDVSRLQRQAEVALLAAQSAFDRHEYEQAAVLLEPTPERFRTEEAQHLLAQVRSRQVELLTLSAEIRQRVAAKQHDGLLVKVERLLALQPGQQQVQALVEKLRSYERQKAQRASERWQQQAREACQQHDYARAAEWLSQISPDVMTDNLQQQLDEVRRRADEVAWITADLTDAVEWDEHLAPLAQRLLKLTPNSATARSFVQLVQARLAPDAAQKKQSWPLPPATPPDGLAVSRLKRPQRLASAAPLVVTPNHAVAAGLALQGLGQANLDVSLLPQERKGLINIPVWKRPVKRDETIAWGVDVGRSSLKALKLRLHKEGALAVEAVEEIRYDDQLDRGEAELAEQVRLAVADLCERHSLKEALVCVGCPGQRVLARFFTLPAMESKKVVEAMKYEARTQIPFELDEVTWDYQLLSPPSTGPAEHEIAFFALKKEHVAEALAPFLSQGLKVDVLQSDCVALHNLLCYERFGDPPPAAKGAKPAAKSPVKEKSADDGDELIAMLDVGLHSSNLVISGAQSVWVRNIPVGGSQLTAALVRRFNLTAAQAEKLKRQPTAAPALVPLFDALDGPLGNLHGEVRRSLEYYLNCGGRPPRQLLLTGGGARLHGLAKRFSM